MKNPRKILLVRPDRLGDMILSLPVAETLKTRLAQSEIHYLASPYTARLSSMVDYVDGWLLDDDGHGGRLSLSELVGKIKAGRFDCLIDLKASWRTSAAGFLSGTALRIGTSRRAYSLFYSARVNVHRKASGFHQTDLDLAHLRPLDIIVSGIPPRFNVTARGKASAEKLMNLAGKPYIVIHPGSGGSSPNWPIDNYRRLAELFLTATDFGVVITNRDKSMAEFDNCVNIGGKTDLETLAGVIGSARLFISGSTGPLHMADALGTKCLSFFARRADIGPARWGPRRNQDGVILPENECDCGSPGSCRCLETVTVEKAFNKAENLLRAKKSAAFGKK